jgi:glutamate 5-kinase
MKKQNNIIVIKIGTAVLSTPLGKLDSAFIEDLSAQVSKLSKMGYKSIIVSSGAIRAGIEAAGLKKRPNTLSKLQAAAAIGQITLMKLYDDCMQKNNLRAAQVLLTRDDFTSRKRYLNAYNTLYELLYEFDVVPIINENDTVATEEIKFGDNDELSSLVANLLSARQLIILTNVDGLLSNEDKKVIPLVTHISNKIQHMATKDTGEFARGGMKSKLAAVKMATTFGIPCVIANGKEKDVVLRIIKAERIGTTFLPQQKTHTAKKRWIAFSPVSKGSIYVDDGAKKALTASASSLLAAGVKRIEGDFLASDIITIKDLHGEEFAKGVSNFSAKELNKIKGLKSHQITQIIKRENIHDEVVHRDNMVVF